MVGQAPPYGYCGRESAADRRKRRFACFAGDCSVVSPPTRTRNAGIANVGHKCPTYVCCHQPLSRWGKPHPTDIAAGIRRRLAKAAVCALVQRFAGDGSVVRNAGIAFMVGQAPPYGYCGRESAAGRRKRRFARWFSVSQATVVWCGMLALRMSGINARPTFAVTNRFHGGASPTLRILRVGIRRGAAKVAVGCLVPP